MMLAVVSCCNAGIEIKLHCIKNALPTIDTTLNWAYRRESIVGVGTATVVIVIN